MKSFAKDIMFNLIGYAYEVTLISPEAILSKENYRYDGIADIRTIIADIAFTNYGLSKADIAKGLKISERSVLSHIERYALILRENKDYAFIRRMIHQYTDDHISTKRRAYFYS